MQKQIKKLITWATLAIYLTQPVIAAASVAADQAAATQNRPTIDVAANGVPIVQIAPPSVAGISHNQYQQFNVGPNGLILNNSAGIINTKLAGYIPGNANLTGNGARVILNEVTGPGGSYLRGYTEIAGQRADLIIANPNGIVGNGFGFINAGRTVLTTGIPIFGGSGSLDAFRVTGGQIAIQGAGLNASDADRVDLLSRAITVNAGMWAKEINAVTGTNKIDYTTLATEKLHFDTNVPQVALDVGALGGMYANKIRLMGTEKGVGFNSVGTIAASGDLVLTSQGQIALAGKTTAEGNIGINTTDGFHNSNTLYAKGNLTVNAQTDLHNSGLLASGQNTILTAQTLSSSGTIGAGIKEDGSLQATGNLTITTIGNTALHGNNLSAGNFSIATHNLDLTHAKTYAGNNVEIQATGDINNNQGKITSDENLTINAKGIVTNTNGNIEGTKGLHITADRLMNEQQGRIVSGDGVFITTTNLLYNNGLIGGNGTVSLASQEIQNNSGTISGQNDMTITTEKLSNTGGTLVTNKNLTLTAQGQITSSGTIAAGNHIQIQADSLAATGTIGAGIKSDGSLHTAGDLTIRTTKDAILQGKNIVAGNINIQASTVSTAGSNTYAGNNLTIHAVGDIDNSSSKLTANGKLDVTATGNIYNNKTTTGAGEMKAEVIHLAAANISNRGGKILQYGADGTTITAINQLDNTNGEIITNGNLTMDAQSIDNTKGNVVSKQQLNLTTNTDIQNNQGNITSDDSLTITANDAILNTNGNIESAKGLHIKADRLLNEQQGRLISLDNSGLDVRVTHLLQNNGHIGGNGAVILSAQEIKNNGGKISAQQDMNITTKSLSNDGGTLITSQNLNLTAQGQIISSGTIVAGNHLQIQADSLTATGTMGAGIQSDGSLNTVGDLSITTTNGATLQGKNLVAGNINIEAEQVSLAGSNTYAGNNLIVRARGDIDNSGSKLIANQKVDLTTTGNIYNDQTTDGVGQIKGEIIHVEATNLSNRGGKIVQYGNDETTLTITNGIDNTNGEISTNGNNVKIHGTTITNKDGKITHAGKGQLNMKAAGALTNIQGNIVTNGNLAMDVQSIDNTAGNLASKNSLMLNVQGEIQNSQGTITGDDSLLITAQGLITNNNGNMEGAKDLRIIADSLINGPQGRIVSADTSGLTITTNNLLQNNGLIGGNGTVTLTSKAIQNSNGKISGQQDLTITGDTVSNTGGTLFSGNNLTLTTHGQMTSSGTIAASKHVNIQADSLTTTGTIGSGIKSDGSLATVGDLTIITTNVAALHGKNLAAGNLKIQAGQVSMTGSNTYAGSNLVIHTAGDINNSGSKLTANNNVDLSASGKIYNDKTDVSVSEIKGDNIYLAATSLSNQGGKIIQYGTADTRITIANEIDNTQGEITTNGNNLTLQSTTITNKDGKITHAGLGALAITDTAQLNNANGKVLTNGNLTMVVQSLDNTMGNVVSKKQLNMDVHTDLQNNQGSITSDDHLTITTRGTINNNNGSVEGAKELHITADQLINGPQGRIVSADNSELTITTTNLLQNSGLIGGNGMVTLMGKEIQNNGGRISAQQDLTITGESLDNKGGVLFTSNNLTLTTKGQLTNSGTIAATNHANIQADNLTTTGTMGAGIKSDGSLTTAGDLTISTTNGAALHGKNLAAGNLKIQASQVSMAGSNTYAGNNLLVHTTGDIDNSGSKLIANGKVALTATGRITNDQTANGASEIKADNIYLSAASLSNQGGQIVQYGTADTIIMTTNQLDNTNGEITTNANDSKIQSTSITNQDGKITHAGQGILTIKAAEQLTTLRGNIQTNGNLVIDAQSIDNTQGNLASKNQLQLNAQTDIQNNQGNIISGDRLAIATQGTINNSHGNIEGAKKVDITAASLVNDQQGRIVSIDNSGFTIATTNLLQNNGLIGSNGTLVLSSKEIQNHTGRISAQKDLTITAQTLSNDSGTLVSNNNLNLTLQGQLTSSGTIIASQDAYIQADSLISTGTMGAGIKNDGSFNTRGDLIIKTTNGVALQGKNLTAGNLDIEGTQVSLAGSNTYVGNNLTVHTTGDIDNTNGKLTANKTIDLIATGIIKNQANGQLHADQINLAAASINNQQGKIVQYGINNSIITATNHLDNTSGEIATNGEQLTLQGSTITNTGGEITHAGQGQLNIKTVDQLHNVQGKIRTNGNLAIEAQALDNTAGNLTSQKQLLLQSKSDIQNSQGNIISGDSLTITAQGNLNNTKGNMEAAKKLDLVAYDLTNTEQGRIVNLDHSGIKLLVTNSLQNGGLIGSNGIVSLTGKDIKNQHGKISAKQDMIITADTLSNVGGILVSSNNLNLTVQSQITNSGTIAAGNDADIQTDTLTSTGTMGAGIKNDGSLNAAGNLTITVAHDAVLQGNNLAAGNLQIHGKQVSMANSSTYAGNNLTINAAGDIDNTNSKLTANQKLDVTAQGTINNRAGGQLQAEQISLLAENVNNQKGKIIQYGQDNTTIIAINVFDNTDGQISTNASNLALKGTSITNTQGQITHAGQGTVSLTTIEQLNNKDGKILTNGSLVIDAQHMDNANGNVASKKQLTLSTKTNLQNSQGTITSGDNLIITTQGTINNTKGNIESATGLEITTANVTNAEQGRIVNLASGALTIKATNSLENSGLIGSNGTVTLRGQKLQNSNGQISAKGDMTITADSLRNETGTLVSNNDLNLTVQGEITNSGTIVAGNDTHISGERITSTGTLGAGVKEDGSLGTNGDLTIKTNTQTILQGKNLAAGNIKLTAGQVNLTGSSTYAGNNLTITTDGDIDNTNSKLTANKKMDLVAKGTINNQRGGQLQGEQIHLTADNISNRDGKIIQYGTENTVVTASSQLDNINGELSTNGNNLTLQSTNLTNTNGKITHAGQGTLNLKTTQELKNDSGKIVTNGNLTIDVQSIDNTKGNLTSQKQLTLTSKNNLQNSQGNIMGGDSLTITTQGDVTNNKGNIEGAKAVHITADAVTNGEQGRIVSIDNSGLTITTTNLLQNSGLIGGNGTMTLTSKELHNNNGEISANENLTIKTQQGLDNTSGNIYAGKDLTIDQPTTILTNNNGTITAQDNALVKASQLQNNGGKIATNNNLTMLATTLTGSGKLQTGNNLTLNLQGDYLQNQGSEFKANGNLNLTTTGNIINNGTISAVNNLGLNGTNIINSNSALLTASNRIDLTTTGGVANAGRIDSNTVAIKANTISNTGSIIAGDIGIQTNTLSNTGDKALLATTNALTILARDNVENKDGATIYSLGNVVIAGNEKLGKANSVLNQSATIEAGQDVAIFANGITNKKRIFATQEQAISVVDHSQPLPYNGETVRASAPEGWDGYKEIKGASREYQETVTETKVTQDSASGQIIAGRNISLGATVVSNEVSKILAAGGLYVDAPTINNVAIGARRITTQSGNDTYNIHGWIGQGRGGGNGGGSGSATVIHSNYDENKPYYNQIVETLPGTASIMLGNQSVTINTVNLNNTTTHADNIAVGNASTFTPGSINAVTTNKQQTANVSISNIGTDIGSTSSNTSLVGTNTKQENIAATDCVAINIEKTFSNKTVSAKTKENDTPATGSSGTNVALNPSSTNTVTSNTKETIIVTADNIDTKIGLTTGATSTITANNKPARQESLEHIATTISKNPDSTTEISPNTKPITKESTDCIGIMVTPGTSNNTVTTKPTTTPTTGSISTNINETGITAKQTITLPTNGLYAIHKEPEKSYLVETDPRFTSYKNFLSSDYLLQKLSYDPTKVQKRLGDGFYEQKLVRDQITELTGRSVLKDYGNNEEQFKRLLENGAVYNKTFTLQVGVALTPEQMAHLTADIIWMVEKEVDGHKVLVPVVYLAQGSASILKPDGALITGENIQITASGDITNTGSITATDKLVVHGNNILNRGGLMIGNTQTEIVAKQDIINQSGTISGGKVELIAGRDIKNETVTAATHATTLISQQGQIIATNNLTIKADRDINLTGTKVSGLDIDLTAGHNLDIGSVAHKDTQGLKDITTQLTSDITASGNLTLVAKNDLKLSGVTVNVAKDTNITGEHNLEITTVQNDSTVHGSGVLIGITDTRTSTTNIGTSITGKGSLSLISGNNTLLTGVDINVDKDVNLKAGNNLDIRSAVDKIYLQREDSGSNHMVSITTNLTSDIKSGNNITITGDKDVTLQGVQLSAGNDLTVKASGNLIATAVKDEEIYDNRIGSLNGSYTRKMTDDEFVIGSSLNAKNKISLTASDDKDKTVGNIILEGSHINSQKGDVTLTAGQDIAIKNVTEYHETLKESKQIDSGFFSTKVTEKRDHSIINQVSGSTISGEKVTITAGNDLTIKGSNVVGTKDVSLEATNNVNITSAKETGKDEHYSYTKTSGLFSGGGLGFTIGSKSEKITATDQTLGEIGSTIGSTTGNVSIKAGNQVTSAGTTIVADKDLTITGKDVTIDNTINTYDSKTKYELKQSGLTVSIGGGIIDTALSASKDIRRSGEVQDQRLKTLYEYKAVQDLTDLNNTLQGGLTKENLGKKVAVSIGIGSSKMTSEQTSHVETVNTSNINAGGNVTITATAGDINLTGTKMNAKDITLDAKKDINIQGAENKQQTTSNTSSSSFSLGVSVGLNPKTVGYFGNISSGKGTENGTATANTGSVIDASGTLTIKSGQDTTIDGSKVKGNKVTADIKGDLNIASKQDTDNYTAKNQNTDLGFTAGAKIPGSRTGSFNTGKTNSNYASVTDQAGIFAGEDGFNITVGKNTDLKGAVISSDATPDQNKLSTETLTYSDIQNKADYSASGSGLNYSSKPGEQGSGLAQGFTPLMTPTVTGDAGSITHSAISPATIIVGGVKVDPNISRDPQTAINALEKIFDKKTVQEQQELSSLFGQMAYEAVGDMARKHQMEAGKKNYDAAMLEKLDPNNPQIAILRQDAKDILGEWGQGGTSKIALHALVGGIMSNLSGNSFGVGATAEGLNEALQKGLGAWEEKHPGMNQWASLVIGGAVGGLTGGNPTTTGSVTLTGTKYNADVPKLFLGPVVSAVIPDSWIDAVFNPGLKSIFKKVGTNGLDPNQYKCFAVDFGEGIVGRVGYIIDGTGNVFEVTGAGVGASILPISVGATFGIVLEQNGNKYDRNRMQSAMEGLSVSFSFQGGPQGGVSWSPSGTWYGEVGVVANAGVGGTLAKTHYLFNIND